MQDCMTEGGQKWTLSMIATYGERGEEEEEVKSSPQPNDHVTRARDQLPRANAHETCLPVILLCCAPLVPNLPNFPIIPLLIMVSAEFTAKVCDSIQN